MRIITEQINDRNQRYRINYNPRIHTLESIRRRETETNNNRIVQFNTETRPPLTSAERQRN